ncbi:uncharacterized protein H6S33_006234, partial [Morchella sextelata]|uniref:uncharacterized protein n=1 Tax=Morchella sextelata TaxID=1174677 RepID=UPI001D04A28E
IVALKGELEESKAEEEELRYRLALHQESLATADENLADAEDEILYITSVAKAWEAQANAIIADLRSRGSAATVKPQRRHASTKSRYLSPRSQDP